MRITEEFRTDNPEIDWRRMISLQNILAHQYDKINQAKIWQIISTNIPNLQEKLQPLLPPIPDINE
ncbi:MAG: HepT-like ribonuclease domain-containing protein [Microcoleaceae cyanobacterium]